VRGSFLIDYNMFKVRESGIKREKETNLFKSKFR